MVSIWLLDIVRILVTKASRVGMIAMKARLWHLKARSIFVATIYILASIDMIHGMQPRSLTYLQRMHAPASYLHCLAVTLADQAWTLDLLPVIVASPEYALLLILSAVACRFAVTWECERSLHSDQQDSSNDYTNITNSNSPV